MKTSDTRSAAPANGVGCGALLGVWEYSAYRATLKKGGRPVALLTPDGVNALPKPQAEEIVRLLNAAPILEHALRLIANTDDNPEGWATDSQIAEHYLSLAGLSPNTQVSQRGQ